MKESMVSVTAIDSNNSSTTLSKLNIRDLAKLAKTGQYKLFKTKSRTGEEEEYLVRRGKLVKI